MVATSAWRACTTHDNGKIRLRRRTPTRNTNGSGERAMRVSGTSMRSITTRATTSSTSCMAISGPNANSSWIERMSVLARLMTCPLWIRSQ